MNRTAAALVIGNELLSGKVHDANTHTLARALRPLGIELRRVVVIPDEVELIAAEVNSLRLAHDFVFTSGGVGPTHDDVTVEGIALGLGRRVVRSAAIEALLREHYGARLTDGHLHMADVVEGTELFPGASPSWPTMVLGNVFVLPGVPQIFAFKLEGLLPRLRGDEAPFVLRSVECAIDEGPLKPYLDAIVARFADVAVGSYPHWGDDAHRVRVTFDGRDPARVSGAHEAFVRELPAEWVVRSD
ncbi:MAG: competence/damage-inducible protein A [Deltaproteobacteria bacterium]|nr:competence/damage-inducible protein A [Myxococcales bacterium]MDP3220638.1 competence/damage-inducible protein A [Deltaproteobacteria bacterium]